MAARRRDLLTWGGEELRQKGITESGLEAELLLLRAAGLDRAELSRSLPDEAEPEEEDRFRRFIERRSTREPLFYILGEREFWSLPLKVDSRALIPRMESERLVEEAVRLVRSGDCGVQTGGNPCRVLDLGTGNGALALALLREIPEAEAWATDISPEALALAAENSRRLGCEARLHLEEGDLFSPVREKGGFFELIVCNPPYVPRGMIPGLEPEVSHFEPRLALNGGEDGLRVVRRIAEEAHRYLAPRGVLLLEHGDGQSEAVLRIFRGCGRYCGETILKDLSGRERALRARKRPGPG